MIDDIAFLDDATRPRAPKLTGLRPDQRAAGEHLKEIHDHLRHNMEVLREMIGRAAAGTLDKAELDRTTDDLAMVRNFRRFGTLCGQYCQFVHGHHSIEDAAVFPGLAAKSEALRKVTERLQAEHHVVHELLVRLSRGAERTAGSARPRDLCERPNDLRGARKGAALAPRLRGRRDRRRAGLLRHVLKEDH